MNLRLLLAASAMLAVMPAFAQDAAPDDLLKAISQCAATADRDARLACYDGLQPRVKAALAAPQPPAQAAAAPEPTKEEQESWFGLGDLFGGSDQPQTSPQQFGQERTPAAEAKREERKEESKEIDEISAKVTEYALDPVGRFVVFLDNGQVWKQLDSDDRRAVFKRSGDNTVTISRGFLGSYNMTINDVAGLYKVTRVK
jgi:hypothetical protein